MNGDIERLKEENEKIILNIELMKQKKERKKIFLISMIVLPIFVILIGIYIFYLKLTDKSFLLNRTWRGVNEEFYLYDINGEEVTILPNNSSYIEFYNNNKYIEYTINDTNILTLTLGTYSVKNNKIELKAQKFTRDGAMFTNTNHQKELIYNNSSKTFYYNQTANKYLSTLDENGMHNNKDDEKIEYRITFSQIIDYYYYDYYNK